MFGTWSEQSLHACREAPLSEPSPVHVPSASPLTRKKTKGGKKARHVSYTKIFFYGLVRLRQVLSSARSEKVRFPNGKK